VVVDDSCLQADSQPKSSGLVWGSTAACALRCIHQMNRVNSCNDLQWSWWQHYKYRPWIIIIIIICAESDVKHQSNKQTCRESRLSYINRSEEFQMGWWLNWFGGKLVFHSVFVLNTFTAEWISSRVCCVAISMK